MNVFDIQQALMAKGFNPGPADGIMGALTRRAIKQFQAANGLVADGIVGPLTSGKLFTTFTPKKADHAPISVDLPWYAEAWRLLGVTEVGGKGDNQVILNWAKDLGIPYSEDETPWCGLFVAHCIGSQLSDEPLPSGPLGAKNWRRLGNHASPQPGAILVFWRKSPESGLGHVGFYAGEDDTHYHVLGGNQSDKVCVTRVPINRLVDSRWPATVPAPKGKALKVGAEGLTEATKLH